MVTGPGDARSEKGLTVVFGSEGEGFDHEGECSRIRCVFLKDAANGDVVDMAFTERHGFSVTAATRSRGEGSDFDIFEVDADDPRGEDTGTIDWFFEDGEGVASVELGLDVGSLGLLEHGGALVAAIVAVVLKANGHADGSDGISNGGEALGNDGDALVHWWIGGPAVVAHREIDDAREANTGMAVYFEEGSDGGIDVLLPLLRAGRAEASAAAEAELDTSFGGSFGDCGHVARVAIIAEANADDREAELLGLGNTAEEGIVVRRRSEERADAAEFHAWAPCW